MKRSHAGLVALGAIASLAGAGAAQAQDVPGYGPAPGYGGAARGYSDPDAVQDSSRHVTVDVIGDLIYDSNVARGDTAVANARHVSNSDEIFTPTVAIDAYAPIGREAVFLHGNFGYDFYRVNTFLNRERVDLHGGGIARLGPCRETVTGDFNRQQSDLEDLVLAVTKNVADTESVGFNAVCGRQVGLAPFFGVSQVWHDNSNPIARSEDYETFGVNWGLAYNRPALGSLQLFGNYNSTAFPDSELALGGPAIHSGYHLIAGGVEFDRRLGARIQTTVSVSYTSLSPYFSGGLNPLLGAEATKGFNGLTYSADVSFRVPGRLSTRVRYTRATLPSTVLGASFTLDNLLLGDIQYRLGPRISLSAASAGTAATSGVRLRSLGRSSKAPTT